MIFMFMTDDINLITALHFDNSTVSTLFGYINSHLDDTVFLGLQD